MANIKKVTCIDNLGTQGLSLDKEYPVIWAGKERICVHNDKQKDVVYSTFCFEETRASYLKEYRGKN